MGQLKEADFLRWGNTKRMTGLRGAEQDGIWEGIKDCAFATPLRHRPFTERIPDNFEEYWKIASKITPTTTPARPNSPPPVSVSMHSRPSSADQGGAADKDGAYSVRSVPIRMYLPNGPVLQDLAPPSLDSGKLLCVSELGWPCSLQYSGSLNTLGKFLSTHLPLLFPANQRALACPLVQGVLCPLDAEIAWLGACMAGADGWVNVMIGIL